MWERVTLTFLRCSNSDIPFWRLLLSLIHKHDRASSAWQVSRDWMCICWFIAGSWGVFLCILFDMENPASTWPLLPSPFLVKFNLQTFFFFFNPLFHRKSFHKRTSTVLLGDICKKAFAPSIFFGIHVMEGNLNIFAKKMVGKAGVLWLSHVSPTTFSLSH